MVVNKVYDRPVFRRLDNQPASDALSIAGVSVSPLLSALLPLLDGSHSIEQIWGTLLLAGFDPEDIQASLDTLSQRGLLIEAADSYASILSHMEVARYQEQILLYAQAFSSEQVESQAAIQRAGGTNQAALKQAVVVIVDTGIVGSNLIRLLALSGVGHVVRVNGGDKGTEWRDQGAWTDPSSLHQAVGDLNPFVEYASLEAVDDLPSTLTDARPTLLLYAPDEFDQDVARWLNELCLRHRVPFLPYRSAGLIVDIGPLVIPYETGCYVCYERRHNATLPPTERDYASAQRPAGRLNFPLGVDHLAVEAIMFAARMRQPTSWGRIFRLDFLSGVPEVHLVLKLPRCPACGVHKRRPARKLWEE